MTQIKRIFTDFLKIIKISKISLISVPKTHNSQFIIKTISFPKHNAKLGTQITQIKQISTDFSKEFNHLVSGV